MPPARRKAPRQNAPQNIVEATEMIGRYMTILIAVEQSKNDADLAIQQIEKARDALIAPFEAEAKDLFKQLRAWWAVAKSAMTDGKKKSTELAGALIGERTTTPALKIPSGMKAEQLVEQLLDVLGEEAEQFLRRTVKHDKPALIKAIRTADRLAAQDYEDSERPHELAIGCLLAELGLSVNQRDEFFIDRAARQEPDPQLVDVENGENDQ